MADAVVDRVCDRVREGMGFLVLHSGHHSKPFRRLMGTSCDLKWREAGEPERVWAVEPGHPVAADLPETFRLPETEMYSERFDVPAPDDLVFVPWFPGVRKSRSDFRSPPEVLCASGDGEVFRSGCCWTRGAGRIFYFRPGHETYPLYRDERVRRVLVNAVGWAAPTDGPTPTYDRVEPREG